MRSIAQVSGVVAAAALLAFASGASSAADFTMKIGFVTINDQNQQWANWYKEAVESGSKGRVAVQIFPASPALSLWLPQNFIVTATCKPRDVAQYMHYGPLSLRDWPAGTPLYDADTRPPTAA